MYIRISKPKLKPVYMGKDNGTIHKNELIHSFFLVE